MNKATTLLLLVIVALLLVGCGRSRVENGVARDTLFSVERSVEGTYGIFLTHDESVAYCTADQEIGLEALSLLQEHDGEVVINFKSKDMLTDTEGKRFGTDQCQKYCSGSGDSYDCFVTMILTSIVSAPGRN